MQFLRDIWEHRLTKDTHRILLIVGSIALVLWLESWLPQSLGQAVLSPVLTSVAIILSMVVFAHVIRRVLMPRVDLQQLAEKASEHPIGAAIVVFSMAMLIVALVLAGAGMMK